MLAPATLAVLAILPAQTDTFGELRELTSPGGPGSATEFGDAVSVSGDLAAVGAPEDEWGGAVHLFEPSSGTYHGFVDPSDVAFDDRFGSAVDLEGALLAGSAPGDEGDTGAVYLFDANSQVELTKLQASDGVVGDAFGRALALGGSHLLVGAPLHDALGDASGAVYHFDTGTHQQLAKLVASDGAAGDTFGASVAVHGNLALVGASNANNARGAVYLFDLTSGTELAKLTASDAAIADFFGSSVALTNSLAIVGAPYTDDGASSSGSVYVFDLGTLGQVHELHGSVAGGASYMGTSLDVDGDRLIVGGRGGGALNPEGMAYLFNAVTGVEEARYLSPSLDGSSARFGRSVALSGPRALVGAPFAYTSCTDCPATGAAFVFPILPKGVARICTGIACPCGNEDALGGCATSTGEGARLIATGTTSAAADDLVLTVTRAPAQQFGLVFLSRGTNSLPFGDGLRCVGSSSAAICRLSVQATGSAGTFTRGPGLISMATALGCPIDASETWYFQTWFRDPTGPCGTSFNTSDALSVRFLP